MHLGADAESGNDNGILREALRLRVRWVQELTGRAAWELGVRLTESGELVEPDMIRHMTLEHVEAVFTKRAVVIPALVQTHLHNFGAPLPARFQISDRGKVIAVHADREAGGGTGAGGGPGRGPVTYDAHDPPSGSVLVTTTLTPGLGPLLTRLNGIVAETGSVLSHLAILAREAGRAHRRRLRERDAGSARRRRGARRRRHRPRHRRDRATGRRPHEDHRVARRHRHARRRGGLHDRLPQPVGVEPGAVLRPDRPDRRGRAGDRP